MANLEQQLLKALDQEVVFFLIEGKKYQLKAMAKFTTKQSNPDYYYKMSFVDGTAMFFVPSAEMFFIAVEKMHGKIGDAQLGEKELQYDDKKFLLSVENDYQMPLSVMYGEAEDIEGECRFFDYYTEDEQYNLSLGWTFRNGELGNGTRDDYYSKRVGTKNVTITAE